MQVVRGAQETEASCEEPGELQGRVETGPCPQTPQTPGQGCDSGTPRPRRHRRRRRSPRSHGQSTGAGSSTQRSPRGERGAAPNTPSASAAPTDQGPSVWAVAAAAQVSDGILRCGCGVRGEGVKLSFPLPGDNQSKRRAELFALLVALLLAPVPCRILVHTSPGTAAWVAGDMVAHRESSGHLGARDGDIKALVSSAARGLELEVASGGKKELAEARALAQQGAEQLADSRLIDEWLGAHLALRSLAGPLQPPPTPHAPEETLPRPDFTPRRQCPECGKRCGTEEGLASHLRDKHKTRWLCKPFGEIDRPPPPHPHGAPLPRQPLVMGHRTEPPSQTCFPWRPLEIGEGAEERLRTLAPPPGLQGTWPEHEAAVEALVARVQAALSWTRTAEQRPRDRGRSHGSQGPVGRQRRALARIRQRLRSRETGGAERVALHRELNAARRGMGRARQRRECQRASEAWEESPKRALASILGLRTLACPLGADTLGSALREAATPRQQGPCPAWWAQCQPPKLPSETAAALASDVTPGEVRAVLQGRKGKAPGPDGVPYEAWGALEDGAQLLAGIFSRWLREGKVPRVCLGSKTVFLFKKGDPSALSSWRPIALQSTLVKTFTGVLARRLRSALVEAGGLSALQKGFVPIDGCLEHAQTLRMALGDAARNERSVYGAFIDFRNAFGTVSHALIHRALDSLRAPGRFARVVKFLYDNAYTCAAAGRQRSGWVRVQRGVLQGCPLSPLLFCLALDPLLRRVEGLGEGYQTHALQDKTPVECPGSAFADDLVVLSRSRAGLEREYGAVVEFARYAGMELGPAKCGVFGIRRRAKGRERSADDAPELRYGDTPLPVIARDGVYDYLGVSVSPWTQAARRRERLDLRLASFHDQLQRVRRSGLRADQKIEALCRFLLPQMVYSLTQGEGRQGDMARVDRAVRNVVREALSLPPSTPLGLLHAAREAGGLSIPSMVAERDIFRVATWVRLLNCRDTRVRALAWREVADAQRRGHVERVKGAEKDWRSPGAPLFLDWRTAPSGEILGEMRGTRAGPELRTLLRALSHLGCSLKLGDEGRVVCRVGGRGVAEAQITTTLRAKWRERQAAEWGSGANGGAVRYRVDTPGGWWERRRLPSTRLLSFALRARTSTLATGRNLLLWGKGSSRCPVCGDPSETTRHVLGGCPGLRQQAIARHNAVVREIAARAPGALVERALPGRPLRPDIVIPGREGAPTYIVDVAICADEANLHAMQRARQRKAAKYTGCAGVRVEGDRLIESGRAVVWPVVLTHTGTPHPNLHRELRAILGLSPGEARGMLDRLSESVLRGSHAMWRQRCRVQAARRD